jgi:protein TonB
MYSEQNRVFSFAVLASIVLHGTLLFGLSHRSRPLPAPEPQVPIVARIAEPPAPAPTAEVQPPSVEPPKLSPRPKPQARKPVQKATPQPRPAPGPPRIVDAPQAAEPVPAPTPAPAPPPVIARTEPAPAAAAQVPSAQPVEPVQPAPDPRSIAEYRKQIIGAAPRYKRYPPVARENNWEGLVRLRMLFSANGRLASLSVTTTSGYDVLDKQAAEMFTNAAEAVPVPPLLHGKEFAVDVAAVYGLRD